jgi:Zn-dependent peptidase ImmA (M78 family)
MNDFFIKIGKDGIKTDKRSFLALLDLSPIKQYVSYQNAVVDSEIKLSDLKDLATKANVPYPLFFATKDVIDVHLKDKEKSLFDKLPSKSEMQLNSRGKMKLEDIELIVKDLGRKQEFLKTRILTTSKDNSFVGLIAKKAKQKTPNHELADDIRKYLDIDLSVLRKMSKDDVLQYLCDKSEAQGILVSFSSYDYMPQNIDKELGVSGFCVKDKKFPYIFINTRDGDDNPKILETAGRQIFTLVAMLVCIAMNKFVFSTKKGHTKSDESKKIFSIVGNLLIPKADAESITVYFLDDLKDGARVFKVTPSMLLVRLRELNLIDKPTADRYKEILREEIKKASSNPKRRPLQITGYSKYNGTRFSREVVRAHAGKKISTEEVKNILFRKGKMDQNLFQEYSDRFK